MSWFAPIQRMVWCGHYEFSTPNNPQVDKGPNPRMQCGGRYDLTSSNPRIDNFATSISSA
eukprot:4501170-Heterocapsa_arctica.AAC.2